MTITRSNAQQLHQTHQLGFRPRLDVGLRLDAIELAIEKTNTPKGVLGPQQHTRVSKGIVVTFAAFTL